MAHVNVLAGVIGSTLIKWAQQRLNLNQKRFLESMKRQTPPSRGLSGTAEEDPPEHHVLVLRRIFLKNPVEMKMVNPFGSK